MKRERRLMYILTEYMTQFRHSGSVEEDRREFVKKISSLLPCPFCSVEDYSHPRRA
ncbi:hypothetical protein CSUI_001889 [Cystoisospora suis]|uniref:Uncharacterized protein n=1 Tax=Cystoisospora suis TaxID=483139 RepID=A0A2C6KVW7_9APIC|nr:hypothetical protein CSUI_001889 [Cystoisospora suis]